MLRGILTPASDVGANDVGTVKEGHCETGISMRVSTIGLYDTYSRH